MSTSAPPLPPGCPGEVCYLDTPAGRIALYRSGPAAGVPMLLVHSVNAAACAYEARPLFEHFAKTRPVYAFDLPGFGLSDRSDRPYTIRLMTDAVLAMRAEIARIHGGGAIDATALSLGCEFLARAAVEQPGAFRSLALVSRPGLPAASRARARPVRAWAWPVCIVCLPRAFCRMRFSTTSRGRA